MGMNSCAIAVQLCTCGFVLPSFVALSLVCHLPPASWFMVARCAHKSIPIFHWEFSVTSTRGRWPMGGYHGYSSICFLHTLICSLPVLLSIGMYPPFWILLIDKLTQNSGVTPPGLYPRSATGLSKEMLRNRRKGQFFSRRVRGVRGIIQEMGLFQIIPLKGVIVLRGD